MGEAAGMQPLFITRYSLNSENAMFTASELLERINSHIAELQFTRTPQGLYAPVTYVLSMGGKRIRPVLMSTIALSIPSMLCSVRARGIMAAGIRATCME